MEVPVFPVPEIPQVTANAATDSKSATPLLSSPPKTTRKAPGEEAQITPRVSKPSPPTEKSPESHPRSDPPLTAKAQPGVDRRQSFIWPSWKKLDASLRATPKNQPLEPDKLFSSVSGSVWVVITKTMEAGNKPDGGITLGSAVAVSKKLLVTNCHVLKNNRSIRLLQGKENIDASIFAADEEGDRCILSVAKDLPSIASGFRDFSDLKVGEKVYSIGSPSGLEKTLGEGLISGLRPFKSSRLVQTTAPISAGSSGGGLFDSAGNLIGVTTFLLRDAQNLNFAIAVSDFWRE